MRCTLALTALLAAAASLVGAAPVNTVKLVARNCSPMPSKVDTNIRDQIYTVVRQQTKDPKILLITMVTAITESLVNNLDCGDQDSLGIFQQRPSKGWGNERQLQIPSYSINKFLEALGPVYRDHQDEDAGIIAQRVQRAEAGNQYTKNLDYARQLIAEAKASVGGGDDAPAPAPPAPEPKPEPETPKPQVPAAGGGSINVGGAPQDNNNEEASTDGPSDEDEDCDDTLPACTETYVPVSGDTCHRVAKKFSLTLDQLYDLNPELDAGCQNLYKGKEYCVAAASA